MKKYYVNNYRQVVFISWTVIIVLLWIQYVYLSSFLTATLLLLVHIPSVYLSVILTNRWFSRAMHGKKLKRFMLRFAAVTLFIAFLLAANFQWMRWAETHGYFPRSRLLTNHISFTVDFLFAIPSVLVINFGFCGLRLLYDHIHLQKTHLETQLHVLQSQINPHFMFNILNHIHTLIQTDVELASSLLLQYAEILRYQLYNSQNTWIRMDQEIRFLKNFVAVEKIRWSDKVHVSCVWEVENNDKQIPPLLLFVLIENAFKYVSRSVSKPNYIRICFTQKGDYVLLDVENSKLDMHDKNKTSGLGLENMKRRLDILYHRNYHLSVRETDTVYHSRLELWQK
ncbi:sensor histidine kinase [Tannerella forsythia]|uniref:sensor histidine kinase n=1 Tax=Tannerella forsythia TaxID=28112 RepID=UPI000618CD32|nr:histidine kinase [Tannerella forsythia]BAR47731.1 histidine kinase [Tannerella forsythia 3313]